MRDLTENQLAALSERYGQAYHYTVAIEWPNGWVDYFSQLAEDGAQPLLISISDYTIQGRFDGFGTGNAITITLNDAYGTFYHRMSVQNVHQAQAVIGIKATGTKTDTIPLVTGRIQAPVTWDESTRTISFTVASLITEATITYTPNMWDIEASEASGFYYQGQTEYTMTRPFDPTLMCISSEFFRTKSRLNSDPWPMTFGYCRNVPVKALAKSPEAKTSRDVWDLTGGWADRQKALEDNLEAYMHNLEYLESHKLAGMALADADTLVANKRQELVSIETDLADAYAEMKDLEAYISSLGCIEEIGLNTSSDEYLAYTVAIQELESLDEQIATLTEQKDLLLQEIAAAEQDGSNIRNQMATDKRQWWFYKPIPAATGKIIIPVEGSEFFESFEELEVAIEFADQMVRCVGRFFSKALDDSINPYAPKGYFEIDLGTFDKQEQAWVLQDEYGAEPPVCHIEGLDDPIELVVHNPDTARTQVPIPKLYPNDKFNIPLYTNLRVFQRLDFEDLYVFAEGKWWPRIMSDQDKQEMMLKSFTAQTLSKVPDYLNPIDDDTIEQGLAGTYEGYGQDGVTRCVITGLCQFDDDQHVGGHSTSAGLDMDVDIYDYPWLAHTYIEAEVMISDATPSMDATLQSAPALQSDMYIAAISAAQTAMSLATAAKEDLEAKQTAVDGLYEYIDRYNRTEALPSAFDTIEQLTEFTALAVEELNAAQEDYDQKLAAARAAEAYAYSLRPSSTPWDNKRKVGYVLMPVIEQRGLELKVYNPYNYSFSRIRNVFKNNILERVNELATSISASDYLGGDPYANQGFIPTGASIRLFNWLPEQQFVVDTKQGTSVLAVKHKDAEGDLYLAPGSRGYQIDYADSGALWAGYHPPCTVVTLSYNAMLRARYYFKSNQIELRVDTVNDYVTMDSIARCCVDVVNSRPDTLFTQMPNYVSSPFDLAVDPKIIPIAAFNPLQPVRQYNSLILDSGATLKSFFPSLAYQNGRVVLSDGMNIYFKDVRHPGFTGFTLKDEHVIEKSITLSSTDSVTTLFDISIRGTDALKEPYTTRYAMNTMKYGEIAAAMQFTVFDNIDAATPFIEFWGLKDSEYWRTLKLTTTFACAHLELFDIIQLNLLTPFVFSIAREGDPTNGSVVQEYTQLPMPTCPAMVIAMNFKIENGTIDMELWLPIAVGTSSQHPQMWR